MAAVTERRCGEQLAELKREIARDARHLRVAMAALAAESIEIVHGIGGLARRARALLADFSRRPPGPGTPMAAHDATPLDRRRAVGAGTAADQVRPGAAVDAARAGTSAGRGE